MHQTGHVDEAYLLHLIATLPPGVSEIYALPGPPPDAVLARFQDGCLLAGEMAALTRPRVRAARDAASGARRIAIWCVDDRHRRGNRGDGQ
jgi:hypothetical protein